MSQIIRVVNKPTWHKDEQEAWLDTGELIGDVFNDIQTKQGKLSIFRVSSKESMLRVCAAFGAGGQSISKKDCVAIEETQLVNLKLKFDPTIGETISKQVNLWHLDIVELSLAKLVRLALTLKHDGVFHRFSEKEIAEMLKTMVNEGDIQRSDIKVTSSKSLKLLDG